MVLSVVAVALFAPVLTPFDPYELGVGPLISPSSRAHLMGTDNFGRDMLTRVIYGARISLTVALSVTSLAFATGVTIGLLTGYFGGVADLVVMRIIDMMFAFPYILIALTIGAVIGPGLNTVLVALVIAYTPNFVRMTRGLVLSIKQKEYIEATRAIGVRHGAVMLRHILPNALSPLIVQATAVMSFSILAEAGISYLGLGTRPPTPSWGLSLADGSPFLWVGPHMVVFPGLAISYVVLAFNVLGDGLRDILDPRSRP